MKTLHFIQDIPPYITKLKYDMLNSGSHGYIGTKFKEVLNYIPKTTSTDPVALIIGTFQKMENLISLLAKDEST